MLSKPGFCNAWGPGVCVYGGGIHGVKDDGHWMGDGVFTKKGNMWEGVDLGREQKTLNWVWTC